jgi:hypothetical protein
MSDSTFKVTIGVLSFVYFLLFISAPEIPKKAFTFDLCEIVCMLMSLAYLYEAIQASRGLGKVMHRDKFRKGCILYAVAGIALQILSNSALTA